MRVIIAFLAAIVVLAWLGFELRERYRDIAYALFALAGLIALVLLGAVLGLFGG
ncbi:MAG: hypothetical protein GWN84_18160 [Gammaproteobacteria bacterium]|nr:hypothetical protein [Gammaproteobacteria bacterium]NIR84764.1 hypothetical protein [Gammaproteobacteria bacterium]NIR91260.1 hypothetical protein [Gammaproteobacteria bacterium]NIU05807.1 hypothetical protein [Gammaproteobacteria bacterium]NIV52926.1 hypothetical protein [Gammaproteobacteria bacterium]